jgi:radical SAM superfamily enzyme YgiQ (UPF0313 family)
MPFNRPRVFRPPSEHRSYYLPLTSGCANNSCTFCAFYGSRLQIRPLEDIKGEIDALATCKSSGIRLAGADEAVYGMASYWDGRRLFLQDADALVYPFSKLREVLRYLNEKLPHVERIAAYATPQDAHRLSLSELTELNQLKLGILYMGIESGDEAVLNRVGKGVDCKQMIEAGNKVKKAGIALSATIILGLGGAEMSRQHTAGTASILSDIDPDYAGALTLTLVPGTPLHRQWQNGGFNPLSPFQTLYELREIINASRFSRCFLSSMHASNYLSVRGTLPQDRARMLAELDDVLKKGDPSLLRPESLRGL